MHMVNCSKYIKLQGADSSAYWIEWILLRTKVILEIKEQEQWWMDKSKKQWSEWPTHTPITDCILSIWNIQVLYAVCTETYTSFIEQQGAKEKITISCGKEKLLLA